MELFQSVKWFEWLLLKNQVASLFSSFFGGDDFDKCFLSARLDWVCMGVL